MGYHLRKYLNVLLEVILITIDKKKVVAVKRDSSNFIETFFVTAIGAIGASSVLAWVIFGAGGRTETSDKLTFAFAGLGALAFGVYSLKRFIGPTAVDLLSLLGLLTILVGIGVVENKAMSKEHPMGFGPMVLILTLFLTPISFAIIKKSKFTKVFYLATWPPALFVVLCISLAFWQTRVTLLESGHSEYVINEIWGPAAGYNTYQEFVPQYVYLIGWLIKPILVSLGAIAGTDFLVLLLTFFGFFALIIMIWFAKKSWPELPLPILLLAILPFCTPTPGWNRISYIGPASTLLSGPALRVLGGMVVGAVTIVIAQKMFIGAIRRWKIAIPGFVSSLIVWNNLDFGLAATVASLLTISVVGIVSLNKKLKVSFLIHILGQIFGHFLILIFLGVQDAIPDWSLFAWFARQFGGGFGSVLISMPGPVNIAFPLMMGTAATGLYFILKRRDLDIAGEIYSLNSRSATTALYFGAFCTFALPYYVNRSYHAGQMSILYLTLGIALIATIGLISRNVQSKPNQRMILKYFPALILSFMIATVLLIPNPSTELSRLKGESSNSVFPRPPLDEAIQLIPEAIEFAKTQGLSIAFYGEGGNFVHVLTGIDSVNIFNSPLDMFQSDASVRLSCKHLIESNAQLLVVTESARQTFAWEDGSLCDGLYKQEQVPNLGILGVRKK